MKTLLVQHIRCTEIREYTVKGKLIEEYRLKFEGWVDPMAIGGDIRKGNLEVRLAGVGDCMMRLNVEPETGNSCKPNASWGMALAHTVRTDKTSEGFSEYFTQVSANRAELAMYRDREPWSETFELAGEFVQMSLPFAAKEASE